MSHLSPRLVAASEALRRCTRQSEPSRTPVGGKGGPESQKGWLPSSSSPEVTESQLMGLERLIARPFQVSLSVPWGLRENFRSRVENY